MGLPARKLNHDTDNARRPRLRVVGNQRRKQPRAKCKSKSRTRTNSRSQGFSVVCVLMVGLALFGMGRVMLAARATEASILSAELRQEIKTERAVGERLEVDVSALTVPSRIESIAGTTMQMADAGTIQYMEVPDLADPSADAASSDVAGQDAQIALSEQPKGDSITGWLASLTEMAAGEAQVMLVGDVGLASSE